MKDRTALLSKTVFQCLEESNLVYCMTWLTMRNTLYYWVAQWVGSDWKFSLHNRLPMKLVHLNSISAVNLTKPWQLHYGSQRLKELETTFSPLAKQWVLQTKFTNMCRSLVSCCPSFLPSSWPTFNCCILTRSAMKTHHFL